MRWTEEELAEYQRKHGVPSGKPNTADVSSPPFALPAREGMLALGRLPVGVMNKTEAAYAEYLTGQQRALEVLWWKFEGIKLRLADNTHYTPDFAVMTAGYLLELHEVKGGYWADDSRVKIKVAASIYPFKFIGVMRIPKKAGGGWKIEEF